jgi:hypothetical protein
MISSAIMGASMILDVLLEAAGAVSDLVIAGARRRLTLPGMIMVTVLLGGLAVAIAWMLGALP